jgi:hypothetical protein
MFVSPAPCVVEDVPDDVPVDGVAVFEPGAAFVPVVPVVSAALAPVVPAKATVATINPDASLLLSRRIIMALLMRWGRRSLRNMQGLCPVKRLICRPPRRRDRRGDALRM